MKLFRLVALSQKLCVIVGLWLAFGSFHAFAQSDDSNASDPINTVQSYIDAFNKQDVQGMAAAFADTGFILDGMPPHVWRMENYFGSHLQFND